MSLSREEYTKIRMREAENKKYYHSGDGRAAGPHTICLSVNSNCFMRCKMCDIGTSNRERKKRDANHFSNRYKGKRNVDFPLERIKELVSEVAHFNPIIKTNFVEPLLCKNIFDVAKYVKDKKLKYYTITNGWTLEKHSEWIVDIETNLIRVSLDGTREIHDSIRGVPNAFDRAVKGLEAVLAFKKKKKKALPIVGICFTISNYNYFNLVDFMEHLKERGLLSEVYVNFNHLQYSTDWEVGQTKQKAPFFEELKKCSVDDIFFEEIDVDVLQRQIEEMYRRFDPSKYHYYFSPQLVAEDLRDYYNPDKWMFPGTPCYLPWYAAQIGINGDVGIYGHCILPPLGNVMQNRFEDVWNSPRARMLRQDLKKNKSYPGCNRCIGTLYPLRGRD